ncbi:MAG: penicillin-binding protein 2 [Candidatus Omnitrophica bacterium]|nr:penicillin-binding protein 2 [Candidatus Omnitrophota bacterium]
MRIKFVRISVIFIFLFLGSNLLYLEIFRGREFRHKSFKNRIRLLPQEGCRGKILDRNNHPIVDNELSYDVFILPQDSSAQTQKLLQEISRVLQRPIQDLNIALKSQFVAPFAPILLVNDIEIRQAIMLEELKTDFPGIIVQTRVKRHYPFGRLASHLIGYLGEIDPWRLKKLADYGYKSKDIVGFSGIEEKYDYYLRQEEGGLSIEVDHRGRFVRVVGYRPPKNGKDIQLTIDLRLQKIVEEIMRDRIGSVIIMEPGQGEILAMASFPNFNPAIFIKKSNSLLKDILHHPEAPLLNRAISGTYPAGSIFKLVVAIAALETEKLDLKRRFFCSGKMQIGKQEFSCWDVHNDENLQEAISHSCNIFFYHTGLLLGGQLIHDWGLQLGFYKPTGIDLPYEASGFVPSPLWRSLFRLRNWSAGDTANLSIGQAELLVTPLQVCRMMAILANQGKLVTPHVVKSIAGKEILWPEKRIIGIHLKKKTLDYLRQGLRRVVMDKDGTAHNLSSLSVSVAGKTGTAQVAAGAPHGWFAGFFPYKDPKFVLCVFLEHGGSGYAASSLAKQIIEKMLQEGLIES